MVDAEPWLAELTVNHAALVSSFRKRLDKSLRDDAAPQTIAIAEPVTANIVWADVGGGLSVSGRVQVGTARWPDGDTAPGEVVVRAGSRISNGILRVHEGVLRFAGTPKAPVALRDIRLEVLGHGRARVEATCTVFINCTFLRHKGWRNVPANWEMDQCILFGSRFGKLDRLQARVRLSRCALIACVLPRVAPRPKEQTGDGPNAPRAFEECDFWYCDVSPSVVLHCDRGNFFECTVRDGDEFRRSSDLTAPRLYSTDPRFHLALIAQMPATSSGRYVAKLKPKRFLRRVGRSDTCWSLVPPLW